MFVKYKLVDYIRVQDLPIDFLVYNKHVYAMDIIEKKFDENIDDGNCKTLWRRLSFNEKAISLLEKNFHKIDWEKLPMNPNAVHICENNLEMFNRYSWSSLSRNPNAIHILEKNLVKINWVDLCENENAIHIIEKNLDKVNWHSLSKNPNAIHLLEKNLDKVNWSYLSENLKATHILEKNLDKVNTYSWLFLSKNPNAIHILEKNLDKVNWSTISSNPNAIHIIEKNLDKIDWRHLCKNKNAIHIIEKNLDKIYPYSNGSEETLTCLLSNINAIHLIKDIISYSKISNVKLSYNFYLSLARNEQIFEVDLRRVKERMDLIREKLMEKVFHPTRVIRMYEIHGYDILEDEFLNDDLI
jgi:uncharacterized cysteine cluster protein YcgN (CxxCxxCC family)